MSVASRTNVRFHSNEILIKVKIDFFYCDAYIFKDRNYSNRLDEYDDYPPNAAMRGGANNGMYPCSICNRSFASDRIAQHEAACARASKQRRVFDSTKQRLEGTEAAMFYRKSRGGKGRNEPIRPQVNKFDSSLW